LRNGSNAVPPVPVNSPAPGIVSLCFPADEASILDDAVARFTPSLPFGCRDGIMIYRVTICRCMFLNSANALVAV
jgi:hypothetical protein